MIPAMRGWASVERTPSANLRLGAALAFVAGAANAGGFLALGQYTSHMTGVVSSIADNAVLGHARLALDGACALGAFTSGAACTAVLVNWDLRRGLRGAYCVPLALEAALLLAFAAIAALCFMMGLQNAVITKISRAEIRTTHVTGLVTDAGSRSARRSS